MLLYLYQDCPKLLLHLRRLFRPSSGVPRQQIQAWQEDYNHHRPHSGLGNIPPAEFVAKNGLAIRAA
ncbi:integrase core domain-containing protein [Vannielia litorea]|uniref:integrase core domain-containing protein n=1 Tax=Vannielia litorea TaxID=1217970 RepID=UPI001BCC6431|nr:hypothetical protein [Vannielia litorea]